ncbi:Hypothetical protein CINCED_3A006516 [Cinara cedri]|uniref:Uncharacterized protein n=1 Tax=Cinara cedri TaxID=506608 RepID=A0A5E4MU19_9HEMI|nr:Hypothetical protein CINCED_3A006516 [Cinara cedri]
MYCTTINRLPRDASGSFSQTGSHTSSVRADIWSPGPCPSDAGTPRCTRGQSSPAQPHKEVRDDFPSSAGLLHSPPSLVPYFDSLPPFRYPDVPLLNLRNVLRQLTAIRPRSKATRSIGGHSVSTLIVISDTILYEDAIRRATCLCCLTKALRGSCGDLLDITYFCWLWTIGDVADGIGCCIDREVSSETIVLIMLVSWNKWIAMKAYVLLVLGTKEEEEKQTLKGTAIVCRSRHWSIG